MLFWSCQNESQKSLRFSSAIYSICFQQCNLIEFPNLYLSCSFRWKWNDLLRHWSKCCYCFQCICNIPLTNNSNALHSLIYCNTIYTINHKMSTGSSIIPCLQEPIFILLKFDSVYHLLKYIGFYFPLFHWHGSFITDLIIEIKLYFY